MNCALHFTKLYGNVPWHAETDCAMRLYFILSYITLHRVTVKMYNIMLFGIRTV